MNWKLIATPEFLEQLKGQVANQTTDQLFEAINEAYWQNGDGTIPHKIADYIPTESLIDMVFDFLLETDTCDEDSRAYWIDPEGMHKIMLV